MASESVRNSIECWIIRRGMGEEDAVLLLHVGEEPDTPGGFWQPITGGIRRVSGRKAKSSIDTTTSREGAA